MSLKSYSSGPMDKLKDKTPLFYCVYKLSVLLTYLGILTFAWYFVYLAYTIKIPTYNILCEGCPIIYRSLIFGSLVSWLFFLYFYILNEVRFRICNYIKKATDDKMIKVNIIVSAISFILTMSTTSMFL